MSLLRKGSKATLRPVLEDYHAALDHKNAIIATLQAEREGLASTQERYDRAKEELHRARARFEAELRDHESRVGNNQERLELSVRSVQELRSQVEQLSQELKLRTAALREAKYAMQQLSALAERREEEAEEARLRVQEQQSLQETKGLQQERTRLQAGQLREEVEKGRRENVLLRGHGDELAERTHKTQSYIRSLRREEGSLAESLSRLEEENAGLQASISELDTAISVNEGEIANKQRDCQELEFHIASKQLERRKIENEVREKGRQLSAEKEKWRSLCCQLEQAKGEAAGLETQLQDSCSEINFILSKNEQICQVNQQLRDDLTVCQRHFDNLSRVNRNLEEEVAALHATNLKAIAKLREPFSNRGNSETQHQKWSVQEKWAGASRATNFETGQSWRQ